MRGTGATLVIVALLVLAGAVTWNASEQHYQGCVDAARAMQLVPEGDPGYEINEQKFKREFASV